MAALKVGEWPYQFTALGTALTALVTQTYLAHRQVYIYACTIINSIYVCLRIWRFTHCKILYGLVILLAIPSFVLGIVCSIESWINAVLPEIPIITPIVIAWLATQVFVDAFISVTLIIIFSRSRTGFRRMDTVLNRLIRGVIQTGLFTVIFSIGNLITFVVLPTTSVFAIFGIPLGRIYTNTLMDNLLTRESLKEELSRPHGVSEALGSVNWPVTESSQATSGLLATSNLQVHVQRTVEETSSPLASRYENTKDKVVPLPV
ncbi:hypothetical protein J3R82DRAFT_7485 [Butyriboletus roseoflavus]|nr:hypothetical protein J3R82DRAFT_7485 [Butyriboletus roseoflavus]